MARSPFVSVPSRRGFLRQAAIGGTAAVAPLILRPRPAYAAEFRAANDRPIVAAIGVGGMGYRDAAAAGGFGDLVAFCDVDRARAERARAEVGKGKGEIFEDYRRLLDRNDVEIVTISTPDHWHAKIAIEAMQAGKDVYCQKPLTLTIDEGRLLCKVARETGRVVQVGTQQRSECDERFLKAVATVRMGRIGRIRRVTCGIDAAAKGGPFKAVPVPESLNWELWQGQAPLAEYRTQRCHNTFRWWYEYSGGKMTDWGAHHVDIAQWAIGMEDGGPLSVEPLHVVHPVALEKGMPTRDDSFNTAIEYTIKCMFPGDIELVIRHDGDNGILFEGENGRFFVNRGRLTGDPVHGLDASSLPKPAKEGEAALPDTKPHAEPIPDDVLAKLRKCKPRLSHMGNFMACVKDRSLPISDVFSHHRALTTCHLANIAMRLGRSLRWDAAEERIVADDEARGMESRQPRMGYEIRA